MEGALWAIAPEITGLPLPVGLIQGLHSISQGGASQQHFSPFSALCCRISSRKDFLSVLGLTSSSQPSFIGWSLTWETRNGTPLLSVCLCVLLYLSCAIVDHNGHTTSYSHVVTVNEWVLIGHLLVVHPPGNSCRSARCGVSNWEWSGSSMTATS